MAERKFIEYGNSRISYLQFGSGPAVAICFHGYGEDAGSFEFLEKYAGDRFTFFAIDLPFHGHTDWKQGLNCTGSDIQRIIALLPFNQESRPMLIGFSLGGRVVLSLFHAQPSSFSKLLLLAPDGLKVNFWYWLATQTWIGNRLFAFTMKYPGWFFSFLKLMNRTGLVNASIFKFVKHYIGDAAVRKLLYARWTSLRKIKPDIPKTKKDILANKIKVNLIYGLHDRIILPSVGQRFRKGIEAYCDLMIIHSGHQVLHEKHISELLPVLNA